MKTSLAVAVLAASLLPAPSGAAEPAATPPDSSFGDMDANKDGLVDRAEYDRFQEARFAKQAEAMDEAFVAMDKDKNGHIDKTEAEIVPVILASFDGLDLNTDARLSQEELRDALSKAQALEAQPK